MTACLLMYKPPNMHLLGRMLEYMSKKEALEHYARNTESFILQALCPKFGRMIYSEYASSLERDKAHNKITAKEAKERRPEFLRRLNGGE